MIEAIQEFEITLRGGFAIHAVPCMSFVTVVGLYNISKIMIKKFN